MTLTEFLTARYNEAEARLRSVRTWHRDTPNFFADYRTQDTGEVGVILNGQRVYLPKDEVTERWSDPAEPDAFAMADLQAKRMIVDEHPRCTHHDHSCDMCLTCGDGSLWPCPTLQWLALPYAGHADHRSEWLPT